MKISLQGWNVFAFRNNKWTFIEFSPLKLNEEEEKQQLQKKYKSQFSTSRLKFCPQYNKPIR